MARAPKRPTKGDPFGAVDVQLLDLIRGQDAILRATLCTFARRGVAFRKLQPERAAKWLDALSTHPLFKGGQFLFDLLEWEDFMLDGSPPPLLDSGEAMAFLERIAGALSAIYGKSPLSGMGMASGPLSGAEPLPALESGFYLYRDVVLGALAYALQTPT